MEKKTNLEGNVKHTTINLIPDVINPTPDYYCTWQTQLYATSDGKPERQRAIIGEKALFAKEKPYGWAYFYEKARGDLFLVMDDSWDVPFSGERAYFGSLALNEEKFPEATAGAVTNAEALKTLTDRIRALGWKGLGGWVCAGEAPLFRGEDDEKTYWIRRLKEADEAGFAYWKVDWGKKGTSMDFRLMLTALGKEYAPRLVIEQAMTRDIIPMADVYRTYDVPAIMSIPITMQKIAEFATVGKTHEGRMGLINCEDEAYMAAAGGFSMGIMRHPYAGSFPDGHADMSFPAVHRDLKTKMTEVVRAARFHRIAPAFGVDEDKILIDSETLSDSWRFEDRDAEIEAWWFKMEMIERFIEGDVLTKAAPARIARNCPLPMAEPDENGEVPYLLAARNPNGVFSVAALGRTRERSYFIPRCRVTAEIGDAETIGVFGDYGALILKTAGKKPRAVLMQDLAGERAFDITEDVSISDGTVTIPGDLIRQIGTMENPAGDTSEAGVLIRFDV